ncbi:uncharacterized protein B0H18DRAFT_957257 [Fomitopsis serialis]|uniref:uncharacterized protein n=1 Tax=Fomitopsis serialis TaxID=139415 RepID=UPI0020089F4A|nr:uncharacterized protein B0H18DRAFT_957257 [Neoantrodia serialis]KAH9920081.1 hypothetical protein B0H18DRAFT_957257 [Neoantrodia serialis]
MTSGTRKRPEATDENVSPHAVPAAPQRKVALRNKRASLERIFDVPLEIEQEIFGYIDPGTLLNLARLSKSFRARLMKRTMVWLWKRCRQNVEGLPECPSHLSEPAYADLVFSKHCHGCNKSGVSKIIWEASARYCDNCLGPNLVGVGLFFDDPANEMYSDFEELLLKVKINARCSFHMPELLKLHSAWVALGDGGSWSEFAASQREALEMKRAHVKACDEWKRSTDSARAEQLRNIRDQRFSFIRDRLLELDYRWSRIRTQILSFMGGQIRQQGIMTRIEGFADLLGEVRAENMRDLNIRWWPGTVDILLMQGTSYRDRLSGQGPWPVVGDARQQLKTEIRQDVRRWFDEKKAELEAMVRNMNDDPCLFPTMTQAVDLAICTLVCQTCSFAIRFPEVLVHECLRGYRQRARDEVLRFEIQRREDLFEQTVLKTFAYCPWSLVNYSKRDVSPGPAVVLVSPPGIDERLEWFVLCSKDPYRTTWCDLDKRNLLFCRRDSETSVKVAGWRFVITDNRSEMRDWKPDDPLYISDVKKYLKEEEPELRTCRDQKIWLCARCADQWMTSFDYAGVKRHVREM